jgi:hypothetical protein
MAHSARPAGAGLCTARGLDSALTALQETRLNNQQMNPHRAKKSAAQDLLQLAAFLNVTFNPFGFFDGSQLSYRGNDIRTSNIRSPLPTRRYLASLRRAALNPGRRPRRARA